MKLQGEVNSITENNVSGYYEEEDRDSHSDGHFPHDEFLIYCSGKRDKQVFGAQLDSVGIWWKDGCLATINQANDTARSKAAFQINTHITSPRQQWSQ